MRGFCLLPGTVKGEACTVRVHPLNPNAEYFGPPIPPEMNELFERTLDATVSELGGPRVGGGRHVEVRLIDEWLETNSRPGLRRLYGGEPPAPFKYELARLKHYMNGWTRETDIKVGSKAFIWIKETGDIPWLHRVPDQLPSAFPRYPHAQTVGFWEARIEAISKPAEGILVRKVRAVLTDLRIRNHENSAVAVLHGQEPWIDYTVTLAANETLAAMGEAWGALGDWTEARTRGLKVPRWLQDVGEQIWDPDDLL